MPKGKAITALVDTVVSSGIKIKTQETVQWWYRPCEEEANACPWNSEEGHGSLWAMVVRTVLRWRRDISGGKSQGRTGPILSPLSLPLTATYVPYEQQWAGG